MAQRKRRIASPLPYLWGFAQGFAGVYVVDERGNERVIEADFPTLYNELYRKLEILKSRFPHHSKTY